MSSSCKRIVIKFIKSVLAAKIECKLKSIFKLSNFILRKIKKNLQLSPSLSLPNILRFEHHPHVCYPTAQSGKKGGN